MFTHTKCGDQHVTVAVARLCEQGATWPCGWHVLAYPAYSTAAMSPEEADAYAEGYAEACADGPREVPCGATAYATPRGWACEAGHEHVTAEVRYAEGWDYAADEGEARLLAKYGTFPVQMDGNTFPGLLV